MQSYDMGKTAVAYMENLISSGVLLQMPELSVNVNIAGPTPHHIHHGRKQRLG
jgi:hypothetical protein